MDEKVNYYLSDIERNPAGAAESSIKDPQKQIDFSLPNEYIDLMRKFNGGEGEVGEHGWLCLFPIEESQQITIIIF